jgi:peptidoglycan/xylan/chitin deacetylase (PgdA/CDA1 family)
MKQAMLKLMKASGLFAPFRLINRSRALILTYHRFGNSSEGAALSASEFSRQLDYLSTHYEIVPLSFIARRLQSKQSLPEKIAAITIDDGYSDAYDAAFPILRKRGLPATLFVVTDFLDRKTWLWTDKLRHVALRAQADSLETGLGNHARFALSGYASRIEAARRINAILKSAPEEEKNVAIACIAESVGVEIPDAPPPEMSSISWEQAREMDAAGVEIGSHTLTHPILTNVSQTRLRSELVESRAKLEAMLNRKVDLFCYPNGDYNSAVRKEVERAGYACAVTVEHGLNPQTADPLALKRIHTETDFAHFVQSASGFEQVKANLYRMRTKGMKAAGL